MEALEDRTLLSTYSVDSFSASKNQFGGSSDAMAGSHLLGADNVPVGGQFGGSSLGFGVSAGFNLNVTAGLRASYHVDPGTVSATYTNLALTQNFEAGWGNELPPASV